MRLTIRSKLVLGFSTLIIILISFGLYTKTTMVQINDASTRITENQIPSINFIHRLNTLTSDFRIYEYNHIGSTTIEEMNNLETQITSLKQSINKSFTDYEQLIDSEEEQNLFDTVKEEWKEYLKINAEVIKESKELHTEEAMEMMLNESKELFDNASNALLNLVEYNMDNARELSEHGDQLYTNSTKTLIIISTVATLIGIIGALLIIRSITNPLNTLKNELNKLALNGGDLTQEIIINSKDEVGELANAVNKFLQSLRTMIAQISNVSNQVNSNSHILSSASTEAKEGNQQISATMQEMAASTEEQASSSSEVSNTVNDFNDLIEESNKNGQELNNSSNNILEMAHDGNEKMSSSVSQIESIHAMVKNSVVKMEGLEKNTQEISKLVQVINGISEQTNLLALNAAIEAARAGDAGRGFAVVAEEIRKLAEQVTDSLQEITEFVEHIQNESKTMAESLNEGFGKVEKGVESIKSTGKAFKDIDGEVTSMVTKIQSVSNNLLQITENSKYIRTSVEDIASITEENSAGIEEVSASVQQQDQSMINIAESANVLSKLANDLDDMINKFKF